MEIFRSKIQSLSDIIFNNAFKARLLLFQPRRFGLTISSANLNRTTDLKDLIKSLTVEDAWLQKLHENKQTYKKKLLSRCCVSAIKNQSINHTSANRRGPN